MKRLARRTLIFLLVIVSIIGCGPVTAVPTPTQEPVSTITPAPTSLLGAQQYLSEALDIIRNNAFNSKKVDWEKTRAIAFDREQSAKRPAETYDTIRYVLKQLGDRHSGFMTPDMAKQLESSTVANYPRPISKLIDNRIGYVAVFEFGAQAEDQVNKYADEIQNLIIELNKQSVCGWIVDLRENLGGNMYPMIAGLGSLIGEGKLGSFLDSRGQITSWYYRDGQAWLENTPLTKVSRPEFLLNSNKTPVAVLIGPQTASAGEATAISFRGRPNTRFFGEASYGLTIGNGGFRLSDGAMIILATVAELDRTGQEYTGKIQPDVISSNPESDGGEWLLDQPSCKE